MNICQAQKNNQENTLKKKISRDPSQSSELVNTRSARHRVVSLAALRISGSSDTHRHALKRMRMLGDTVPQVGGNIQSLDEHLHQTP